MILPVNSNGVIVLHSFVHGEPANCSLRPSDRFPVDQLSEVRYAVACTSDSGAVRLPTRRSP